MEHLNQFYKHIKNLSLDSDEVIYKTNLELLKLFYNNLIEKWETPMDIAKEYLNNFKTVTDIKPDKIERYYTDLLIEYLYNGDINFEYTDYTGSGIYFIYDEFDNLLYIGKSEKIQLRAFQSFMNKIPYGATYLKIWEIDHIDRFERILIDYFRPPYNNTCEDMSKETHRIYASVVTCAIMDLKDLKQYHIPNTYQSLDKK